jgi:hypothetical protein
LGSQRLRLPLYYTATRWVTTSGDVKLQLISQNSLTDSWLKTRVIWLSESEPVQRPTWAGAPPSWTVRLGSTILKEQFQCQDDLWVVPKVCRVLYTVSVAVLHIVDGDCSGGTLRQAGFRKIGHILSWRDALYSGPVPQDLTLRQLSRLRSRFWSHGKRATHFADRDADLFKYANYDEVVLWFGSDCTLCQLSLVQLLSWFRDQKNPPAGLSWVKQHGGELKPQQTLRAYANRKLITPRQMQLAVRAWNAFRSPAPLLLANLLNSDLSVLRGMGNSVRWILHEYPSTRDGLSRLQHKLLREMKVRGNSKVSALVASVLTTERVGDSFLLDLLKACLEVEHPLVSVVQSSDKGELNYRSQVELTDTGRRVLAGKIDHISLNGIDRWIGGVYFLGHRVHWRWDHRKQKVASVR